MSGARRFAKNSLALTIATVSVAAFGAVYRIYIARYLGDENFGRYTFILTFTGYFAAVALLGFRQVLIREVAKSNVNVRSIILCGLVIRVLTASVALLSLLVVIKYINKGPVVEKGLFVYGFSIICIAFNDIFEAGLIGKQEAVSVAVGSVVSNLLKIVVGIYLLTHGFDLIAVLLLFVFTSLLNTVITGGFFLKHLRVKKKADDQKNGSSYRYLIKESFPFFFLNIVSKVYYKNDILILSFLKGERAVGWYGAAYLPVDFLLLAGNSISAACYPVMTRAYADSHERAALIYKTLSRMLVMLFLPVALGLSFAGPQLLALVLGKEYLQASTILKLLAWLPMTEALNSVMGTMLASMYQQRITAFIAVFGTILSVSLNFALIPTYGYVGAAVGVTLTSVVNMLIADWAVSRKLARLDWWSMLLKPILAALTMTLTLCYLFGNRLLALPFSIIIYVISLLVLRAFTNEEILMIKEVFAKKKISS